MTRCLLLVILLAVFLCSSVYAQNTNLESDVSAFGNWEIGYLNENNVLIPFNTRFEIKPGLIGWCLNDCPGIQGDITVNETDKSIIFGDEWKPGQIFINPGLECKDIIVRIKAPSSNTLNLSFIADGKANSYGQNMLKIRVGNNVVKSGIIDCLPSDNEKHIADSTNKLNLETNVNTTLNNNIDFIVSPYNKNDLPGRISISIGIKDIKNTQNGIKIGGSIASLRKFLPVMNTQIQREKDKLIVKKFVMKRTEEQIKEGK